MMDNREDLIPLNRFCETLQVEVTFIHTLREHGLCETLFIEEEHYIPTEQLSKLEKLIRLHNDMEINIEGLDVILHLLDKIEGLQAEVKKLNNKLNSFRKV